MIPLKCLANRATVSLISRNLCLTSAATNKWKKTKGGCTERNPCCKAAKPQNEDSSRQKQSLKRSESQLEDCIPKYQCYDERESQNEICPPKNQCYDERESQNENCPPKNQWYDERESQNENCPQKNECYDESESQNVNCPPQNQGREERKSQNVNCPPQNQSRDERKSQNVNCPPKKPSAKEKGSQHKTCPPHPWKQSQNEMSPPKSKMCPPDNRSKQQQCQGKGSTRSPKPTTCPPKTRMESSSPSNTEMGCAQKLQDIQKTMSQVACESKRTREMVECQLRVGGRQAPSKGCKCGWVTTIFYILGIGFLANLAYCIYKQGEDESATGADDGEDGDNNKDN